LNNANVHGKYEYVEGRVEIDMENLDQPDETVSPPLPPPPPPAADVIQQVNILKGVDPELDAEAKRVVKSFPPFEPGKMAGKPVPV